MGFRASWSGQLGLLGVMSIPVKLYTSVEHSDGFKRVCPKCGGSVGNAYRCTGCSTELSFGDWKQGYDLGDGQMIPLDSERVSAIKPANTSEITVIGFKSWEDVDPLALSGNHYFVAVAEKKKTTKKVMVAEVSMARRGYVVLRDMLAKYQLVAIGRFVDREREHYACIRPYNAGLLLTKMYFSDYLRDCMALFESNHQVTINQADVDTMKGLVEQTSPVPPELRDEFAERLRALVIQTKEAGVAPAPSQQEEPEIPVSTGGEQDNAVSIFTALKQAAPPVATVMAPVTVEPIAAQPKRSGLELFAEL